MKIITVEFGYEVENSFSVSKREFLNLKTKFTDENPTSDKITKFYIRYRKAKEFLEKNTELSASEILKLAKFFITVDFRIEE